jgi:uncharacterized protein YndB with AHSA1/START domain
MSSTDRIEKRAVLKAPRARVWKAIADSGEFGAWFGCAFDGPFVAGHSVGARVTHPPEYASVRFRVEVERVEPERLLSFRWHPYGVPEDGPETVVELRLADAEGGCELVITESGFDRIPADLRGDAFRRNSEGWGAKLENVRKHVAG